MAETSAQLSCSLSLQPSSVEIDPQLLLTLITLVEPFLTLLNVAPLHDTVASHLLQVAPGDHDLGDITIPDKEVTR